MWKRVYEHERSTHLPASMAANKRTILCALRGATPCRPAQQPLGSRVACRLSFKDTANSKEAGLAVFVSGQGSNLRNLHRALTEIPIRATIRAVVTTNICCAASQFATKAGLPVICYPDEDSLGDRNRDTASGLRLRERLQDQYKVDYILLAGFLKMVPQELVAAYPRAILNIHPSLLPAFGGKGYYGSKVHQAVLATGTRYTGATVHFVDNYYDTGPILAQRIVPVRPFDSCQELAARVREQEHILYPQAVAALVERRISWRPDGIPVMWHAQ